MPGDYNRGLSLTSIRILSEGLRRLLVVFSLKFTIQTYWQAVITIRHHVLLPLRAQKNLIRAEQEKTLEQ